MTFLCPNDIVSYGLWCLCICTDDVIMTSLKGMSSMFTVRVVSLEEELRMSEETVRTLQAGRQQNGPSSLQYMGSSKDGGEVTEGRIEALAMTLSEAAIAKGKTGICKLEQACPKIVLFSVVTSTILSCQGKWKSFRPLWRRREDRSGLCKVSEYTHKFVSYGIVC